MSLGNEIWDETFTTLPECLSHCLVSKAVYLYLHDSKID